MEENYCLLGIVTDEPDYKLCWLINEHKGFNLARTNDLKLYHKKLNLEQDIAIFIDEDESSMLTYRLISNRASQGYFLSDLKHIDYILHIQGDIVPDEVEALIANISGLPTIRMCVPLQLQRIKEKERLQLW